jgi:hypothetical protein
MEKAICDCVYIVVIKQEKDYILFVKSLFLAFY